MPLRDWRGGRGGEEGKELPNLGHLDLREPWWSKSEDGTNRPESQASPSGGYQGCRGGGERRQGECTLGGDLHNKPTSQHSATTQGSLTTEMQEYSSSFTCNLSISTLENSYCINLLVSTGPTSGEIPFSITICFVFMFSTMELYLSNHKYCWQIISSIWFDSRCWSFLTWR